MVKIDISKTLNGPLGQMNLNFRCHCEEGDLISIFGTSGSGKTSILRMICGLMQPDDGVIAFNNKIWFDSKKKINLKPQLRDVGIVFQDYGLFPNMTVEENLKFAMKSRTDTSEVDKMMNAMSLQNLAKEKPIALSGGQQQRVALARTLMQKPSLLLLDEPLAAIDSQMRLLLQDEIKRLHHANGLTTILVSHDRDEVLRLADKVFHLENGKIINEGRAVKVLFDAADSTLNTVSVKVLDLLKVNHESFAVIKIDHRLIRVRLQNDAAIKKGDLLNLKLDPIPYEQ